MEILYLGHAGFYVRLGGKSVVFDPWLSSESKAERAVQPVIKPEALTRVDLALITHEHYDHFDQATLEPLISRTLAHVVAPAETLENLDVPHRLKMPVSEGERFVLNGVEVTVHPAKHPQSVHPVSFKVQVGDESFYHAGDTYDFYELSSVNANVGALPIGGTYTMDVLSAITALKRMRLQHVIPMHYDTFAQIRADARDFEQRAAKTRSIPHVMQPGDSIHL